MILTVFNIPKKAIFYFLLLFLTKSLHAQFYHGIEVGTNYNTPDFIIDTSQEPSGAVGFSLGYVAERDLSENLYVKLGVLATQKRHKATNIRGFNTTDETWGINAVEIPINLGYYINYNNRNRQIFIDAGINIDYIRNVFSENSTEKITYDVGGEGDIKRIATGATVGVGLLFSKQMKVRVHYNYGLTSLAINENDQWKNNTFGISFNYFLKRQGPY